MTALSELHKIEGQLHPIVDMAGHQFHGYLWGHDV